MILGWKNALSCISLNSDDGDDDDDDDGGGGGGGGDVVYGDDDDNIQWPWEEECGWCAQMH